MAFPTIPTAGANTLLSATTSPASTTHTFPNLTTLAPAAGDLIIAICVTYQGGSNNAEFSSWGASLNEILDDSLTTGTGNGALGVAYKVASGSESGTFTVTSANSFKSVQFLMRIPADTWHGTTAPEVQAATRAAGAIPDPGSFSPSWGAEDNLWISLDGHTETSTTGSPPTLTASPTNYSGDLIVARVADAVGDITAGVGFRQLNTASEDAGVWTGTNTNRGNGIASVIAVRPAVSVEPVKTVLSVYLACDQRFRYIDQSLRRQARYRLFAPNVVDPPVVAPPIMVAQRVAGLAPRRFGTYKSKLFGVIVPEEEPPEPPDDETLPENFAPVIYGYGAM